MKKGDLLRRGIVKGYAESAYLTPRVQNKTPLSGQGEGRIS
jgi:hypothetical protein